ncbi:MAG: efflux RND transporter periplasmic adaptor subunit [Defluviitaleaceae bacterium]|nr:efflux RND transporter periplasmic adaptor subunit [Defluviitaleaceae bacterium]
MSDTIVKGEKDKKKKSSKIIIVLVLTLVLAGGAAIGGFFLWRSFGYLTTDNARVTTTLVGVSPALPGTLERFTVYEGKYVTAGEVIGWVENDEAMRSPINGLVVYATASPGQSVMPGEALAIIADTSNIHIQANFEETDIPGLERGQRVIVTIDLFGSREFEGYISEIGRITPAELSGQAMFFNTGGTFTRVVPLLPVQITLVEDIDLDNFIGVNARVRIPLR